MNWQRGLEVLVMSYLDEGPAKRGSLREAVELIQGGKVRAKSGPASSASDSSDSEAQHDDDTSDSSQAENDVSNPRVFGALKIETLKRNLLRWKRDLGLEHARNLRVALTRILKQLGPLLDLLEPLADAWSTLLGKDSAAEYDDILLCSWTSELIGNVVSLYSRATRDPETVIKCLQELAEKDMSEFPVNVEDSIIHLGRLVQDDDVRDILIPAIKRYCASPQLRRGAILFFAKPLLGSRSAIQKAFSLPVDDNKSLWELCQDPSSQDSSKDRFVISALLANTDSQSFLSSSCQAQAFQALLAERLYAGSALSLGDRADASVVLSSSELRQTVDDSVEVVQDKILGLENETGHVLASLSTLLLSISNNND